MSNGPRVKKPHYVPQSYPAEFSSHGHVHVFDKSLRGRWWVHLKFTRLTIRGRLCQPDGMPKRTRNTENLDPVQNRRRVVLESVESTETVSLSIVQQVMREMGARGGKIGGKRRLETMTDAQRKRSAQKAAKARWAKAENNQ